MRKTTKGHSEKIVKDIKRATSKQYSSEEQILIVLDGLLGEDSITELCRREGISNGIYYKWSKDFMEAGKRRLAGDTSRAANADEVKNLRGEVRDLKEVVAEQTLKLRLLRKVYSTVGATRMRYVTSEKLKMVHLVEGSHLSARRRLA
ncbi:transposase [Yoonia sp. R2331]|uniref:transposase n=1 Tax=Yoonia sp. R2331 TaxID=3237238 RepID=UPI0034E58A25